MARWQPIETAPKDGTQILGYGPEGHEIVHWLEHADDCPDQPGNDAGWEGVYAWPGRSFGDKYRSEAQGQPYCWQPLIDPEIDWDAEPPTLSSKESSSGDN